MHLHPGLQVFYSNLVERLAAQLALDVATFRADDHGWKPATLVVPNPNVRDYLKRGLADAFGVAANLRFHFLEGFWRTSLGGEAKARLLDRSAMRGALLSLLGDEDLLRRPELAPVRTYLGGSPRDLKRVQLAERLAGFYEGYLLHRPDWLKTWERGHAVPGARPEPLATWQAAIWRELRTGLKAAGWRTLPEWLEDRSFSEMVFPEAVFVFGMSHMAPLYHRALARVGERAAVRLYLMNPCREPWDSDAADASARACFAGQPSRDLDDPEAPEPYQLSAEAGNPILHRWARPGREQLRLLGEVTQGDLTGRFGLAGPPSILTDLQARILDPSAPRETCAPDASLRVIPCPTPAREAEVAASLVWELLRKPGSTVHFDDICVLVPPAERDRYLLHLQSAFANAEGIPWAQAMGASRALESFVEAAGLLLRLATGELSRAELLRAAAHPVLARRWQGLDPDAWPGLCERAGIVARLDASETEGTYLEGGAWTWEQGMNRLALGCFMKEDAASDLLPVAGAEAPGLVASLGALAADLRALGRGRHAVSTWLDRLARVLRTYVLPDPGSADEGEEEAFARLLKGLERLRSLACDPLPAPVLDFPAFRALATGALASLLSDHALPPGRGVQIGCYAPLRAIPFKALFLLGLGEGRFPAADRPDPMDLLAESPRRAGDVSAGERDRYLFLEALLSARETLVITYPSQDALTGDALQPSPLLLDLAETLGPGTWAGVLLREQPRHRHDPRAFPHLADGTGDGILPSHLREAREEAELHRLGRLLRDQAGGRELPLALLDRQAPAPILRELDPRLRRVTPLAPQAPALPDRLHVSLAQLKRWLECPVQGGEALRLGIRNVDDEDPADLGREPLDTSALERHGLLREAFWSWLASPGQTLGEAYGLARAAREARARVPRGPLAEGERPLHLAVLETWRGMLPGNGPAVVHRFGSALPGETAPLPVVDHPLLDLPLVIDGHPHTVRLEGLSAPMHGACFLLLTTRAVKNVPKQPAPSDADQRQLLSAWLAHVVLCAQGDSRERQARLLAAHPDKAAVLETTFPPCPPQDAQALLAAWLGEVFGSEPPRRLMPIEALLSRSPVPDLREFIDRFDENDEAPALVCFRGPIPRITDLEAEPDLAPGRRRLGGFLEIAFSWRSL